MFPHKLSQVTMAGICHTVLSVGCVLLVRKWASIEDDMEECKCNKVSSKKTEEECIKADLTVEC